MRYLTSLIFSVWAASIGSAEVRTKTITYDYQGTTLKGFLAYDDAAKGPRPGVLIVHEWWGLDAYAKMRAEMLAKLGYVAFCADMYGEGKTTDHPKEASEMAGMVRKNIDVWQGRAIAALKILKEQKQVDPTKLAAMGYCFGGSTALQLAYSGADLKAVVTFHAALPKPTEAQARNIKAEVLVCHGEDDTFISPQAIKAFREALDGAKVKYDFQSYKGAVHSFTVPDADKRNMKGMAYNKAADETSWKQMQELFLRAIGK